MHFLLWYSKDPSIISFHSEIHPNLLFGTFMVFINSVRKIYPLLTNVADVAFTAYFVHDISVVDDRDLVFVVA